MFGKLVLSGDMARFVKKNYTPLEITLGMAKIAASDEVAIMHKKVARVAIKAGKNQDSVVFEGIELQPRFSCPGPWKARIHIKWSRTNREMKRVTLKHLVEVSPVFAEMFREEFLPHVPAGGVAAYLLVESAKFGVANPKRLSARRAKLQRAKKASKRRARK